MTGLLSKNLLVASLMLFGACASHPEQSGTNAASASVAAPEGGRRLVLGKPQGPVQIEARLGE